MSKQDLNAVRTAQDLERKYDLSSIAGLKKNYEIQKQGLTKVENELTDFAKVTTKNLEDIQNQVDGNITTWFSSGIPTLENYPTNEWITDTEKNNHLGDLYYDQDTGYAYRFALENKVYSWLKITDNDVTEALALANSAKDTADRKRQVFVVEPTPPYDVGDLWIKDEELYRCQTSRPSGETFEDNDWIKATKYTDDTVANQVDGKLTILSGTVTEIRQDVDELNTTMTNTTKLVDEHGNTIGTLQEKQSEISQTVNSITTRVSTVENDLVNTNSDLSDLSDIVDANTTDIGTIKTNVSELQQTDEQIKASVESIDKQIIPTATATGSNIYVEDASDDPLIQLEIEGKSEQATRSGKNLLQNIALESQTINGLEVNVNNDGSVSISGTATELTILHLIPETGNNYSIPAGTYILSGCPSGGNVGTYKLDTMLNGVYYQDIGEGVTFTITEETMIKYARIIVYSGEKVDFTYYPQLEAGSTKTEFEKYGASPSPDYPSEIESVGYENLYDKDTMPLTTGLWHNSNTLAIAKNGLGNYVVVPITGGKTYTVTKKNSIGCIYLATTSEQPTDGSTIIDNNLPTKGEGLTSLSINTSADANYLFISLYGGTPTDEQKEEIIEELKVEEDLIEHSYIPYGKYGVEVKTTNGTDTKSSVIVLNEPLRSLPNGVKDIAYIKNNKLYVDRYVGSVVFNGSENWRMPVYTEKYAVFSNYLNTNIIDFKSDTDIYYCSHFKDKGKSSGYANALNKGISLSKYITDGYKYFYLVVPYMTTDEWKTWLSENKPKVTYELAEPYTEELGELEMPSTFKGVNHITTTDELEPIINIEYVRDTILSNYVEGQIDNLKTIEERHYAELGIENDNIKASVTEINSNLSDMTEDIHTVQETLTSTEKTIDIISTNIDKTTGEIREVTTTSGYTFNADGLDIHKSDKPFHAKHQYDGTYYYDKETIVSETTVDGFMAVKTKNKGSQEYCYDESNKVYEFVKERIEVDGEYGYATFYNGVN